MTTFDYGEEQIYFQSLGEGQPVVFLHGDTASGRMFEPLMELYAPLFHIILIDFAGNGRSSRRPIWPTNAWEEQAHQTVALLDYLAIDEASLVGTSGGAYTALNVAMLYPDRVTRVVADAFSGIELPDHFAEDLRAERATSMASPEIAALYEWWQGEDWKDVVEANTASLVAMAESSPAALAAPIDTLTRPTLLIGSRTDTTTGGNIDAAFAEIQWKTPATKVVIFDEGDHPTIYSRAEEVAEAVRCFLH